MPPGAAPGADESVPGPDGSTRWEIPFWALQVAEIGVALLLVTQSVHVGHGGLLIATGAALAALAVTADGPLGIDRICSQRLHYVLVVPSPSPRWSWPSCPPWPPTPKVS